MTDRKGTSRRMWGQRILDYLKKNEPRPTLELMEKLKVPDKETRTFYRALGDLRAYGTVVGDAIPRLSGQEMEEIKATIGPRALRLEIPLKKELARKLLNDRPLIRRAILRRNGFASQILRETGLLE